MESSELLTLQMLIAEKKQELMWSIGEQDVLLKRIKKIEDILDKGMKDQK